MILEQQMPTEKEQSSWACYGFVESNFILLLLFQPSRSDCLCTCNRPSFVFEDSIRNFNMRIIQHLDVLSLKCADVATLQNIAHTIWAFDLVIRFAYETISFLFQPAL